MQPIVKSFLFKNKKIQYIVQYQNIKKLSLKIENGQVVVNAPKWLEYDDKAIESILIKNINKILEIRTKSLDNLKFSFIGLEPWIKIFDKKVQVKILDENINIKIKNNVIYMKNYYDDVIQLKKIYSFLSKEYKNWFINRTNIWSEKMNIEYKNITLKFFTRIWGSCLRQQAKISYNIALIHYDTSLIDSVIVHELSHIIHPNHSREFYNHVTFYLPNYKELQKILNTKNI